MKVRAKTRSVWKDRGELSYAEIYRRTSAYWTQLVSAYKATGAARRSLLRQRQPEPGLYEHGQTIVKALYQPVQNFLGFLEQSRLLPFAVCNARYPLSQALSSLAIQLSELDRLIVLLQTHAFALQERQLRWRELQQVLEKIQQTWPRARRGAQKVLALTLAEAQEIVPEIARSRKRRSLSEEDGRAEEERWDPEQLIAAGRLQMQAHLLLEAKQVPSLEVLARLCKLSDLELNRSLAILLQRNLITIEPGGTVVEVSFH